MEAPKKPPISNSKILGPGTQENNPMRFLEEKKHSPKTTSFFWQKPYTKLVFCLLKHPHTVKDNGSRIWLDPSRKRGVLQTVDNTVAIETKVSGDQWASQ